MAQLLHHRFKPAAIAPGLQANDYSASELRIKLSYFLLGLMPKLAFVNLPFFAVAPLNQLLPCMKINATIRNHGDSFLVLKLAVSVMLAARESPASLHQLGHYQANSKH
jgi:hypothetical protein